MSKKTGRPVGSKTADRDLVDAGGSRCPRCGCTDRSSYSSRREIEGNGISPTGEPYTSVILRNTQCLNSECGQHRVDRFYMNAAE